MSSPPRLGAIRACFEGVIPVGIATVAADGWPNVTYLSQVHYLDEDHVALSYQFFNKTRANLLTHPVAELQLIDPTTGRSWRLTIRYLRTETAGPLFETMKAKLAGIASHSGMAGVFRLLGADVCRVERLIALPGEGLTPRVPPAALLPALRGSVARLAAAGPLDAALDGLMQDLEQRFRVRHAALLLPTADGQRLYTLASLGYPDSGVGSEIAMGQGVIGVAAREGTPIRIGHMTVDQAYARALKDQAGTGALENEIPFPGLASPGSQLAVPVVDAQGLLGVLFVEDPGELRFGYDEEDALVVLADALATRLRRGEAAPVRPRRRAPATPARASGPPLEVRHYAANDSLFLGEDYLIKGVAGAILWTLLRARQDRGREEFTNRELRLDPALRLPAHAENLEARLILLQRRLAEKASGLAIEKTGRGRFRLAVRRPVRLLEM